MRCWLGFGFGFGFGFSALPHWAGFGLYILSIIIA